MKSACLPLKTTTTMILHQAYEPAILDQSPDPYRTGSSPKPTKSSKFQGVPQELTRNSATYCNSPAQPELGNFCPGLIRQLPHSCTCHSSLLPIPLKPGNTETSITELAVISERKGKRSNEVAYKTEEKRMAESTEDQ